MTRTDALDHFETIRHEDLGGGVRVVRLHRPERRNAWTLRMALELDEALTVIDRSPDARVLIITGSGDVFSVGADLESGSILQPGDEVLEVPSPPTMPSAMSIPVIAAMNGHAAGAGISFALHCDIRILAESAKVAFAFVRRGVIPEMGTHWLLPRVVGLGVATELILTGRTLTADEALATGLVHRLRPTDQVLDDAIATARELVRTTSPLASSFAKQLVWTSLNEQSDTAWHREMEAFTRCAEHPDAIEGVASFLERRDPIWTAHPEQLPAGVSPSHPSSPASTSS